MGRQKESTQRLEASDILQRLSTTAAAADAEDLSRLAQLHEWCEALVQAGAARPEAVPAEMTDAARAISRRLEALILGEAADAASAFAEIVASIRALAGETGPAGGGGPADAGAAADAPSATAEQPGKTAESVAVTAPAPPEAVAEPDASPAVISAELPGPSGSEPVEQAAPQPASPEEAEKALAEAVAGYESVPLHLNPAETDFVKGFVEEAGEHIESIESALLEVEQNPEDRARIDDLFRPFHTIKGMAGFLNLRDINCLTHEAETLLDQGRKGVRPITPGLIDLIFSVVDILKVQIAAVGEWVARPHDGVVPQPPVAGMITRLRGVVAGRAAAPPAPPPPGAPGGKLGENLLAQGAVAPEVLDVALETQRVERPGQRVGEILMDMEAVSPRQVAHALRAQRIAEEPAAAAAASQAPQAPQAARAAAGDQSVRIDTAKLDALVDIVGELVIAQTLVNMSGTVTASERLLKDVSQVTKIVRDVQELAMSMRMLPIGPTFQKMARLVRDVSRKAGKLVNLTISGEDTEVDKNVIQMIGDPLIHMVRNAVDHGIEPPDVRRAAGKPEAGHVHLDAGHQGGNIVIRITDDGKGMDAAALIRKGIEKGLVKPGQELSDQEAFGLIFAPGFSTAAVVTDISGRGVGMDVVRRNIESLRGRVDIASEPGRGSTFTIRLPLTLAIIDGMVIRLGGERLIIPTIVIDQSLRPRPEQITVVQQRGEVLNIRGRLIPLVQLGRLFGLCGRLDPCRAMVVIAHCEGRLIGLVVEELIGQQQVVIKTLGERFQGLKGISGAAILGDGRVGLILEVGGVEELHNRRRGWADEEAVHAARRRESRPEPAPAC